jgi:pantoate--beta-alanine ligase
MNANPLIQILHTPREMQAQAAIWRRAGERIAFVPTMGALHEGHLSLIEQAAEQADRIVASIFVNPTQFGANEDFDSYPRQELKDIAKLAGIGADAVYLPKAEAMYPEGYTTHMHVAGLSDGLCGASRKGHFDGVATVVAKLLNQVTPDIALFGEKDYQQLQIIKRMVQDLNLPITIIGVPTLRAKSGLALSSRNQYLSEQEREIIAPQLYSILLKTAAMIREQWNHPAAIAEALADAKQQILHAGFTTLDYLELCDAQNLRPVESLSTPNHQTRLIVAAFLGKTRLIDNVVVGG